MRSHFFDLHLLVGHHTAPQIRVDFLNENVLAFALDLTSNPNGNDLTVNVFSGISNLGSTLVINVQGTGTFLGMRSDTEVITHITISNGNYFGVDDIAFAVPEPTAVALTGIGVALMTLRREPEDVGYCEYPRPALLAPDRHRDKKTPSRIVYTSNAS